MEQLFSQYGRIITSRILVDQVTGIALFDISPCRSIYPHEIHLYNSRRANQTFRHQRATGAKIVTSVFFLIRSRHITRSGLHPVWQEKWSRGGYQRTEWTEAFGCSWAHNCQVRQQPEPEDRPGLTDSAVPNCCPSLHRAPASSDSAFQVLNRRRPCTTPKYETSSNQSIVGKKKKKKILIQYQVAENLAPLLSSGKVHVIFNVKC